MVNEIPESPNTRVEMYLNRIATGGGVIPEKPITRLEQYLDYIANHGIGADLPSTTNLLAGDGSGGAADSGIAAGGVALAKDYRTAEEQDAIDGGLIPKSAQSAKSALHTQPIGVDADGKLWTTPGNIEINYDPDTGNLEIRQGGITNA